MKIASVAPHDDDEPRDSVSICPACDAHAGIAAAQDDKAPQCRPAAPAERRAPHANQPQPAPQQVAQQASQLDGAQDGAATGMGTGDVNGEAEGEGEGEDGGLGAPDLDPRLELQFDAARAAETEF